MSGKMIPLYIDLKSPYSYLAAHRALALEKAGKVTFDWQPFELNIAGRADADRLQGLPGVSDPVQKEVFPGS